MTYKVQYTESGEAALQDGEYREPVVEGSSAEAIILLTDHVACTELEDGTRAAVGVLVSSTGGSGVFYDLALVVEQEGEAVNVATTMIGDRIRVTHLEFEGDEVIVEMITQGEDEPMCCPTEWARVSFGVVNGELLPISYETLGNVEAPELIGIAWKWSEFQEMNDDLTVVDDPDNYTTTFKPDDSISIQADCNAGGGNYQASEGSISIQIMTMTMAACDADSRSEEFVDLLNQAVSYIIEGGYLYLSLPMDGGILKLSP